MKRSYTLSVVLVISLLLHLNSWAARVPVTYKRLLSANRNWALQPDVSDLNLKAEPAVDDRALLRTHLRLVENVLRNRAVSHLSPVQRQNRQQHLDNLHNYWLHEGLPVNTAFSYRLPIFIDGNDNFCAVGYLLKASGEEKIARDIARSQRYAYLPDIVHSQLGAWAASGFTMQELAWIQPVYTPEVAADSMNGGTNGSVYTLTADTASGVLYAGGAFNQAGGISGFSNIAAWTPGFTGGSWVTLGSGLVNEVRTTCLYQGNLYAGGFDLLPTGAIHSVARWDGSQWTSPSPLSGRVTKLFTWQDTLFATVDHTPALPPLAPFALYSLNTSGWTQRATFNGKVLDATEFQNELVLAGEFTAVNGTTAPYLSRYDGSQFSPFYSGVPVPVRSLAVFDDSLYAGGDFYNPTDTTKCLGLSHWNGTDWVNMIGCWNNLNMRPGRSVNSLMVYHDTLFIGGNYDINDGMYFGRSLSVLYESQWGNKELIPRASLDSTIHSIANLGQQIFLGGDFQYLEGTWPGPNYIAGIYAADLTLAAVPSIQAGQLVVYPNPATSSVNVQLPDGADMLVLFDIFGRKIRQLSASGKILMHLSDLPAGMYQLHAIEQGTLSGNARLVVE